MRKHGSPRALLPALAGAGVSIYTMLVDYHLATALVGFALLATATFVDYRLRRWASVTAGKRGAAMEKRVTA